VSRDRDRDPYVEDYPRTRWGLADACRRSAQIDREEAHTLDAADPRQQTLAASAAAWERQAARLLAPDKRYQGSRADDYGTAITVQVTGELDGGEYPLPYLDAHELERRLLGTAIPQADTPEGRSHEWGYEGSGARDTAASLLADYCGEPQPASVIQVFKRDVVARLDHARFSLPGEVIARWLDDNGSMIVQARAWMQTEAGLLAGDPAAIAEAARQERG
jgi:Family of unknown function (DUF6166)